LEARKELEGQGRGIGGILRRLKKRVMWLGVYEGKKLKKISEEGECVELNLGRGDEQTVDTQGEEEA
jgi:hypothetical protein